MDLLVGTVTLRPYVFAFLALFLLAGAADLGWWRTLGFAGCVWPVAWLSEFSSTRIGVPFGLYHYTGATHGRELYIADVPLMDALSFTFLAYASFCLARAALSTRPAPRSVTAVVTGVLMMALDVVIDPLAVRGDRWFLGQVFTYAEPGIYFGVPFSNFAGWVIVGVVGVGLYLALASGVSGRRAWPGVALYYGVFGFNLAMTMWIGEWLLAGVGAAMHVAVALTIVYIHRNSGVMTLDSETRRIQRA
jgi:putative membrane protein